MNNNNITNRGIKPGSIKLTENEYCIGFCEENQTWHGWRADGRLHSFGIGTVMKKCYKIKAKYGIPVGFKAKTLDDCKKMAMAYADN